MKTLVQITVTFEVSSYAEKMTEMQAREAASEAVFNHLAFTENGSRVVERVGRYVDGVGACIIRIAEEEL